MDKDKFEPENSSEAISWHEDNCERCLRFKMEGDDPYAPAEDSCEWERKYFDHAFSGLERPSDEIINKMFDLPLCSGLERSDLEALINPSNNSNSSIQEGEF